jgi:hypothetical protein
MEARSERGGTEVVFAEPVNHTKERIEPQKKIWAVVD